ncbi:Putative protein of unknown function [Podospora comata]|uniref:AAR2 protein n=1 Tax=Podospora comata TaxID=48703 RepID=A0ABY6SN45_PODCO|nr:Putative protein of unknown function [Podospora comata]
MEKITQPSTRDQNAGHGLEQDITVRPNENDEWHESIGDALRILDLPDNFTLGLDLMTMTTTTSLQGFQKIPPGRHFLWVQQPGAPFRSGYWFVSINWRGDFWIIKWDNFNEVLAEPTPEEKKDAVDRADFEKLVPYTLDGLTNNKGRSGGEPVVADYSFAPTDSSQPVWSRDPASLWAMLTDDITTDTIPRNKLEPRNNEFLVDSTTDRRPDLPLESSSAMQAKYDGQFHFIPFSHLPREAGSGRLIGRPHDEIMDEILSEIQFSFLTGTLLSNLACLEHWWDLVLKVVLKSWDLVGARPKFVGDMITILHAQLYFTEVCLEGDNTPVLGGAKGKSKTEAGPNPDRVLYQVKRGSRERLKKALESFRQDMKTRVQEQDTIIRIPGQSGKIAEARKRFEELECFLFGLGWDLGGKSSGANREDSSSSEDEDAKEDENWNSEDDDDQPVMVELDEKGREVGLVSFND